jgi:hypothetical protein
MKETQKADAFENVKDQIGFCGIWCGSCVVGNGTLREMTKRYKELINTYDLKDWGPKDFDYDEFYKGLESIENMPLCQGCLKDGGRDNCEIRACAKSKKLQDCTLCSEFGRCEMKLLEHMRTGALKAGLMVLNQGDDRVETLEKWTQELKSEWPSCILFAKEK